MNREPRTPEQEMARLAKDLRADLRWMTKGAHQEENINILLGAISARFPKETLEWVMLRADANRSAGIRERREQDAADKAAKPEREP